VSELSPEQQPESASSITTISNSTNANDGSNINGGVTTSTKHSRTKDSATNSAVLIVVTQFVGYAIYFVAQRFIISSLSKTDNGNLVFIYSVVNTLVVLFVDPALTNVLLRDIIQLPEKRAILMTTFVWYRVITASIASLLIIGYFYFSSPQLISVSMLVTTSMLIGSRVSLLRSPFELQYREVFAFKKLSLISIADYFIYVVLLFSFASILTIESVAYSLALGALPGFLYLVLHRGAIKIAFGLPDKSLLRLLVVGNLSLFIQSIFYQIHNLFDMLVLKAYAPVSEIGIIGVGANISIIFSVVITVAIQTLAPMITDKYSSEPLEYYREFIWRTMRFVSVVMLGLLAVVIPATPLIIEIYTGGRYSDNRTEIYLQEIITVLALLLTWLCTIITSINKERLLKYAGVILVVGSLSLNFILIPTYWGKGYLSAKIISNIVAIICMQLLVRDILGTKNIMLFSIRFLIQLFFTVFVGSTLINYISVWLAVPATLAITTLSAFILQLMPRSDLAFIYSMLSGIVAKITKR
jgi:O-antigen/teichoic acid export membrane protein